jgi:hypothetical protein
VTYFDYSSPAPYFLLLVSFMLAMIAMLTSGSNKLRWIHTDRQWTREVSFIFALPPTPTDKISATEAGRLLCRVILVVNSHPYVLRSLVPALLHIWWIVFVFRFSLLVLIYFTPAMLLAGISSQSTVCRALTVLWMVTYIANTGTISTEFVRKYATSLNHARFP